MEYKKDKKDWAENSARIYHLVLIHCPPVLIAELQNHSRWIDGKELQYCIAILLMIRDPTHGIKETRQGTMALVQVHVDLFTTTQRPNESVEVTTNCSARGATRLTCTAAKQGSTRSYTRKRVRRSWPREIATKPS